MTRAVLLLLAVAMFGALCVLAEEQYQETQERGMSGQATEVEFAPETDASEEEEEFERSIPEIDGAENEENDEQAEEDGESGISKRGWRRRLRRFRLRRAVRVRRVRCTYRYGRLYCGVSG